MNPTIESYTVAMPWYERDDFTRLWQMAHDRDDMPADYDVWHARAVEVMTACLARGRALQIITIRSEEFQEWLADSGLQNTAATRLRYVEMKAIRDPVVKARPAVAAALDHPHR